MIKGLYGVAGLGPVTLARYINKVSGGCALVSKSKVHRIGDLPKTPSVVYASVSQFVRHHHRIAKDHLVFIVDAPEVLSTIKGVLTLGYLKTRKTSPVEDHSWYYTSLTENEIRLCLEPVAHAASEVKWTQVKHNPFTSLLVEANTDQVLSQIRAVTYSVPNKELRAYVLAAAFMFLTSPLSKLTTKALSTALKRLPSTKGNRLALILSSPKAITLRKAYLQFKQYPDKQDQISSTYEVSAFCLNYLKAKSKLS